MLTQPIISQYQGAYQFVSRNGYELSRGTSSTRIQEGEIRAGSGRPRSTRLLSSRSRGFYIYYEVHVYWYIANRKHVIQVTIFRHARANSRSARENARLISVCIQPLLAASRQRGQFPDFEPQKPCISIFIASTSLDGRMRPLRLRYFIGRILQGDYCPPVCCTTLHA